MHFNYIHMHLYIDVMDKYYMYDVAVQVTQYYLSVQ